MAVITISGQIGSRARVIGRLVAEQLKLDYIDQEILVAAAQTLGVSVESVAPMDERTASFSERLAAMLRRFLERSAAAGASDPMLGGDGLDILLSRTYSEAAAGEGLQEVPDELYVSTLANIIGDLADHGDVLILGRGSQVILRDQPETLHILTVAPLDIRIQDLVQREGLSEDEAKKELEGRAKGRASFHHKFFRVDVDDPALYHLTLNSAHFSPEEATQLIVEAAERFASRD